MSAARPNTFSFILGSATVMIGAPSELWDMIPSCNSVGLVKSFSFSTTPTYAELTQGCPNELIFSVKTGETTRVEADLYEFTARNLVYSLSNAPDPSLTPITATYTTVTDLIGSNTAPITTAFFTASSDLSSVFTPGTWIMLQEMDEKTDHAHYAELTAPTVVTGSAPTCLHMLTFANQGLRTGNDFLAGSRVAQVNEVNLGVKGVNQTFVSVKVVGIMPYKNLPVVVVLPKVRITQGFSFSITDGAFSKLPLQMKPHLLLRNDPFFEEFGGDVNARLFVPATWGGNPRYPNKNILSPDRSRLVIGGNTYVVWR